jgi:hypothetical protein
LSGHFLPKSLPYYNFGESLWPLWIEIAGIAARETKTLRTMADAAL